MEPTNQSRLQVFLAANSLELRYTRVSGFIYGNAATLWTLENVPEGAYLVKHGNKEYEIFVYTPVPSTSRPLRAAITRTK